MTDMTTIEERTRYYAAARDELATRIQALDAEVVTIREQHRAGGEYGPGATEAGA